MNSIQQREPNGVLRRLILRARLTGRFFGLPLRTLLALETLSSHFRHRTREIRLGEEQPIPWFTYSFIEHLLRCDLSQLDIFEWGMGHSTLFWATHARFCTAVEHDAKWHDFVSAELQHVSNYRLILAQTAEEYVRAGSGLENCDVVVIDGKWRYRCAEAVLDWLPAETVIIVDNSDWRPDTCALLQANEFARVDFFGFGPSNQFSWSTSLFFKSMRSPLLQPQTSPTSVGGVPREAADYMFLGEHES